MLEMGRGAVYRVRVVMFCVLCTTETGDGCHAGDGEGCRVQTGLGGCNVLCVCVLQKQEMGVMLEMG